MKKSPALKVALLAVLIGAAILAVSWGGDYLSFDFWRENLGRLQERVRAEFGFWFVGYFAAYVLMAALSIPGALVLTLGAGALFGLGWGLLLVSFASALGADLAFLASRFLFSDWIRSRYRGAFETVDRNMRRDGSFYLFAIRLNPAFPFFLTNLVLGLTRIRLVPFHVASQLGMLPGTFVYVNAGQRMAEIDSPAGLLSPVFLVSLAALGLVPLIAKKIFEAWKSGRALRRFPKPGKFDYNVIVIGAGAAGLVASYIAAFLKAKVLLIERHKMGGDCLNTGCVPSKALLSAAKRAHAIREGPAFGISTGAPRVDFKRVMESVREAIRKIEPHDSIERYTGLGVDCATGEARIMTPFEVEVGGRRRTARAIIVATGAEPRVPDLPGLRSLPYLTSENLWSLPELPGHLLVLGGGAIGCEMAQAFRRLGAEVTLVEKAARLIPASEPEASRVLEETFRHEGIQTRLGVEVRSFEGPRALFSDGSEIEFTHVLVALGRSPRWTGYGLEELGLLDADGKLELNESLQTKIPNIWACGDASGLLPLTHLAAHGAWSASVNALFSGWVKFKVDLRVIPSVVYTDPEVAQVGKSGETLARDGIEFDTVTTDIGDLDRAIADGHGRGFVRIHTAKGSDRILGATIVADRAGEMIAEITLAMRHKLGLRKILQTVHPYPTWSEAVKATAGAWGQARKPERLLEWVARYHRFRRGAD